MKQIILSFFIVIGSLAFLQAQITLDASYFPTAGDTLYTNFTNVTDGVEITAAGGNQVWNFSILDEGIFRERIIYAASEGEGAADFPNAEMFIPQVAGGEGYYNVTENEFSVVGYFGDDPIGQSLEVSAPFSPAYVERWAPLNFFDLNENNSALLFTVAVDDIPGNIFDGLPITPDSIRVKVNTDRTDLVDGWGSLEIPGMMHPSVLREKRTEYREVRLEAKVGVLPWLDVTDVAIDALPIEQLGADTIVTYTFWAPQIKEPLLLITADANEVITSVEYKTIFTIVSVDDEVAAPRASVLAYPNPTAGDLRFDLSNFQSGTYELAIFNLTGTKVWNKNYHLNGDRKIDINLGHLPNGYYIHTLTDNKGNRLSVNRFLIMDMKP